MAKEINLFEPDANEEENEQEVIVSEVKETIKPKSTSVTLESLAAKQQEQQQYTQARLHAKRVVEALLFASSDPIPFQKIREIVETIYPFKPKVISEILTELEIEYHAQQRSFQLEEIAQGYILRSRREYGSYIELLYRNKRGEKLSHAAAEVLAIVAYKQPVTRPDIESIRGVDSTGIVQSLLERQLIEPVGRLEAPGRPTQYGVTKEFLKYFGLNEVKDLLKMMATTREKPIAHGPAQEISE